MRPFLPTLCPPDIELPFADIRIGAIPDLWTSCIQHAFSKPFYPSNIHYQLLPPPSPASADWPSSSAIIFPNDVLVAAVEEKHIEEVRFPLMNPLPFLSLPFFLALNPFSRPLRRYSLPPTSPISHPISSPVSPTRPLSSTRPSHPLLPTPPPFQTLPPLPLRHKDQQPQLLLLRTSSPTASLTATAQLAQCTSPPLSGNAASALSSCRNGCERWRLLLLIRLQRGKDSSDTGTATSRRGMRRVRH